MRDRIVDLALSELGLLPRDLAVRFTDTGKDFVSEAAVYRLLKSHDLVTSPAHEVLVQEDRPEALVMAKLKSLGCN